MAEKVKIILLAMMVAAAMILGGFLGGWSLRGNYDRSHSHNDTIVIERVDTVTLVGQRDTLISIVWKPYPVAVHDTTWIHHHTTDSIFISLPYQYRYFGKPDTLDVWYSGIDPRVDSARVYMRHTTEIVEHYIETNKMMPLTLEIGAGTQIAGGAQPSTAAWNVRPYGIAKMSLNRPSTTFEAFGMIDTKGRWGAGLNVTYRVDLIK